MAFSPFVIAEIVCRFEGYGGYPPVLREPQTVDGRTYVASHPPGISTFFFKNLTVVGGMVEQVFVYPKPKGTIRIFALGGSAMRGYPQPPALAATSFLQAMLGDVWPRRNVEVLNFGTTAIASFPVMYILDEAVKYDPDLVIVYSGNNEFYGAHGVASVHAFGRSTGMMRLVRFARRSALVQWINDLTTREEAQQIEGSENRTLMEAVVADSQIDPDDARRSAAMRNLENHLTEMVEMCKSRNIPIILCTLPANERDLAPLGEDTAPRLASDQLARYEEHLAQAKKLLPQDPEAALAAATAAADLYDNRAALQYLMGRCLTALGRDDEAAAHYVRAKDLDTMPWRAPSAASDVVRRVAENSGAILSDLAKAFRDASPSGAIGWELMDDHVHPTLKGQALIARTWLQAMEKLPAPLTVEQRAISSLPPWNEYAVRLGANKYDAYAVDHRMLNLFDAPFYSRSNPAARSSRQQQCSDFEARLSDQELRAIEYWCDSAQHGVYTRPITGVVGAALMAKGDFAAADPLFMIARHNVSRFSLWNLELTWKAITCRQHEHSPLRHEDFALARQLLHDGQELARATGVISPQLHRHLGLAYNLVGDNDRAIEHLAAAAPYVHGAEWLMVAEGLADSYLKTGHADRARAFLAQPTSDPLVLRERGRILKKFGLAAE